LGRPDSQKNKMYAGDLCHLSVDRNISLGINEEAGVIDAHDKHGRSST